MQARVVARVWQRESQLLSRFFVVALAAIIAWLLATLPLPWAALLLAAVTFVVLVFVQPRWALYLLPFAVPFGSIREVAVGPATVGGTEALLALFLLAWVARGVARRELRLQRPPLLVPILLWYGVMLLSTVKSASLADSVKELLKWGETFALYAIAAQEMNRRDIAVVVGSTLLAGTLAALEGIYQALFLVGPEGFLFPLGGRVWLRAYGRFIQPNPYAGYLGLVLPLAYGIVAVAVGLGASTRRSNKTADAIEPTLAQRLISRSAITILAGTVAAVLGVALLLTLSRGAWIGVALAAVAVGSLLSRRAAVVTTLLGSVLALGIVMGGSGLLPPVLAQRATDFLPYINVFSIDVEGVGINETNFAVLERLAHWQAARNMWVDAPWLGQGIGNYAAVYANYNIPPWEDPLGHAHNLFLNTLAETGLLGLVAYSLFWGSALLFTLHTVYRSEGVWRGIAVGVLGAQVHLHAHNFFDNLYVHGIYLHLALLLAIVAILHRGAGPIRKLE